ncbi:glycosyltransferase [Comamonas endophytica]|uniref:Glycosyltransferase n=1 Tax=Comamonas endophytica TaxID=2949090 RepID=A0ABY6G640_9BURK|nr:MULTISPECIES: glycosyltransferase [unclassified Acidovorax]MCD2511084.1 glycosyltransferase [Acidovorax sp. D4N7]UYG50488.1 glycosyltransferase [Acidovorax sp. 5MLIR]
MQDNPDINSNTYWNHRFSTDWETCDGPRQSRFFARLAIENMPAWLFQQIRIQALSVADWGCAQGDGTDYLGSHIPCEQLAGVDFSETAVQQAAGRYPAIRFLSENWVDSQAPQAEQFDMVFSSNTLEHFHNPWKTLDSLITRTRKCLILMLPYGEINRITEHFYSFLAENIPGELNESFRLIWSRVIDCTKLPDSLWPGEQILLIYAEKSWLQSLKPTLGNFEIGHFDVNAKISDLTEQADSQRKEISKLKNEAEAHLGEISDLINQAQAQSSEISKLKIEAEAQLSKTTHLAHQTEDQSREISRLTHQAEVQRIEILDLTQKSETQCNEILELTQQLENQSNENSHLAQQAEHQIIEIANLKKALQKNELALSLHHREIHHLKQDISTKEDLLTEFEAYRQDKENYIAQLLLELQAEKPKSSRMHGKFPKIIARVPYYARASMNIIRNRGFIGYAKAVKNKLTGRPQDLHTSYIQPLPVASGPAKPAVRPLLEEDLVIITGVPFDDVGGGQRAAQLARCALKTGRNVVYLYIYQKFDFEMNQHVESNVQLQGLTHLHIAATSPETVLRMISSRSTVIFEFPHPAAIPYLDSFNKRGLRTVFELIDDWETSLGGGWFDIDVYRRFVADSQSVTGTAKLLVERLRQNNRSDAIYSPNAANEYIFDKYKTYRRPSDLQKEWQRIGLYFGSLYGEWFAWDYLKEAAIANAGTAFVLIGDRPEGKSLPSNVHMLGAKSIEELPGYLAHSDFCLLPFSPGKISDAVSPIKIFEYLFSGKTVVSTNLPEVNGYPGVLIGNSPGEFAQWCSNLDMVSLPTLENDRFISQNSWFSRLDVLLGKQRSMRFEKSVSAVILIHNNQKIIGRCLETLLHHSQSYLKEIIVVDNSSSDGGAEYVEMNFPTVKLIRNPVNGCSSGRNLGAASATGKYLAFFDSDQWFTSSSCFEEALTLLERDANIGAIGWGAGWFDRNHSDLGGMITDYCPHRGMNQSAVSRGYRADIGYLATCGFFIPKSVFDATSGFDVFYDPTCFEDTDLSFQIKQLGLDVCYRDLTGIRHQPHQTTGANSGSDTYNRLFNRNANYFKEKWKDHGHFLVEYLE